MQGNQDMYQASDGKWYPKAAMPQGYNPQQGAQGQYPQQGGYSQQGQGYYGNQQPMNPQPQAVYVDQGYGRQGGRMGAGGGLLAGLCAGLLCFDLGACLC